MAEMQKHLAQMSPQERKQMEAMLAQQGVRCRMTQNQRSGNTQKFAFSCSNIAGM